MVGGLYTKRNTTTIALATIVFLLALAMTLYPVISNYVNEKYASEIHTAYVEAIEQVDNGELENAKEQAIAYNQAITPGAASDAYSREALQAASKDYDSQLNVAGDGIMGYVEIPIIGVNLPIYHGTNSETLERGIGHLLGSSLPVGGKSTHTILSGHSGLATEKMFTDVTQMKTGDVFYLHILGETLAYQVVAIYTVEPHDTTYLGVEAGEDLCTLVTCTPIGINTHRLLVRGQRIHYEKAEVIEEITLEAEQPVSNWEQEYIRGILMGLTIVLILGLVTTLLWRIWRVRHG